MNNSLIKGLSFGLNSGVITTLGLLIGLYASTNSKLAVIGGILTIAVADALSDAIGMSASEESQSRSKKERYSTGIATFFSKFIFALTFAVPILIFSLKTAVIISAIWGILLIIAFSIYISKLEKTNTFKEILSHTSVAILVIIITFFLGKAINYYF